MFKNDINIYNCFKAVFIWYVSDIEQLIILIYVQWQMFEDKTLRGGAPARRNLWYIYSEVVKPKGPCLKARPASVHVLTLIESFYNTGLCIEFTYDVVAR